MLKLSELKKYVNEALSKGTNFALYSLPMSSEIHFLPTDDAKISFWVVSWLQRHSQRIELSDNATATIKEPLHSTPKSLYLSSVKVITEKCGEGKVVYSRVLEGETDANWGDVAAQMFQTFPGCFCFIYHIKRVGTWMGATPEPLLRYDRLTGRFATISLAGTRAVGTRGQWDSKNLQEHELVVSYITNKLRSLGLAYEVSTRQEVRYGNISHLCHHIAGYCQESDIPKIVDALNPTPALCGTPKDKAITMIEELEDHPRLCYGGLIGIDDGRHIDIFVNLRCLHLDGRKYWLFAGGGITAQSVPQEEWKETEAKMAFFTEVLK